MKNIKSKTRFLFFYAHNWQHEISDYENGRVPSHRLFGLADLKKAGWAAFACPPSKLFRKVLLRPQLWCLYQALFAVLNPRSFDCMVATHEVAALPVLFLKRIGIVRKPIIILSVALLHPRNLSRVKHRIWSKLLPQAEAIVCYASAQIDLVQAEYKLQKKCLFYFPLGVDTDYFSQGSLQETGNFCLSVGTNDGKDFPTLIQALPAGVKLIVVTDGPNSEIIKAAGGLKAMVDVRQGVPISELKRLYEAARFHVIPIREMPFSSGQTVLLENMALGKVLIISDTSGIRDYVEAGVTAICVEPGNVDQLKDEMQKVWNNPEHYQEMGRQAADSVRLKFSSQIFAQNMVNLAQQIDAENSLETER